MEYLQAGGGEQVAQAKPDGQVVAHHLVPPPVAVVQVLDVGVRGPHADGGALDVDQVHAAARPHQRGGSASPQRFVGRNRSHITLFAVEALEAETLT